MKKLTYPTADQLVSEDFAHPGVIRAPRGTNPVNTTAQGHRETAPLETMGTPRVKHPKLNTESWVTSYAQSRQEPRMARAGGKARAQKRRRQERGNQRGRRGR